MHKVPQKKVLLINPPVSKPGEPPAGIARLAGALASHGIGHTLLDANLEALLDLMGRPAELRDTWTRRAFRSLDSHLHALRNWPVYRRISRYKRAVLDLNRVLQVSRQDANLSLANYEDRILSPLRSRDLIRAAENPEQNPFFGFFRERLLQEVEGANASLAGFSLNYLSQALSTFAMVGYLKRNFPELKIVLGGGLITSWARTPGWRNPFSGLVDSIIAGAGEAALLTMMGQRGDETEILSRPTYDALPLKEYLAPGLILPYSASMGCYWNRCLFCPERAEGNPYRPISPDRVIGDLELLIAEKEPVLVHFLDNAISPALLGKLATRGLAAPWYGFARITADFCDLDFCVSLKESGCVMLQVGVESGDPGVLDALGKGMALETASAALRNLRRAGIDTYVYLLFGTPPETEIEARRTLEFTVRHSGEIGYLNLAIFNLPSRGQGADELKTEPFYEGDLSLYSSFSHPRGWNRNLVRAFLDKEFRKHPAIAPILRREPPVFTSNHAPLFCLGRWR